MQTETSLGSYSQHTCRQRHRPSPEELAQLVGRDDWLRGQVEGSAGIARERQPIGTRHVPGVERLELQAIDAWNQRDEPRPYEDPRQQRSGKQPADLGSASREKINPGRSRTTRTAGFWFFEAVEQSLDRRLVPRE